MWISLPSHCPCIAPNRNKPNISERRSAPRSTAIILYSFFIILLIPNSSSTNLVVPQNS